MKNGVRFFLLAMFIVLAVGVAPAASGADPTQVMLPNGDGFTFETLDGTVTGSVQLAPGTGLGYPGTKYSVASDESIVYDDATAGAADVNNILPLSVGPVWLVGSGKTPLELDSSPYDFDASISYSGSEVTFARWVPATHSSDLYVVNADGSGLTRLASGEGNNFLSSPKFSPDQGSIAYLCAAAGEPVLLGTGLGCGPTAAGTYAESGLMLMSATGSDQRMIVSGADNGGNPFYGGVSGLADWGDESELSWSPDGSRLTMPGCPQPAMPATAGECQSEQVFAYPTDGSDAFDVFDPSAQVTHESSDNGATVRAQFCGSSTQILFQTNWDAGGHTGPFSYLIDLDGANRQQVTLWPGTQPGYAQCVPPATGGGPPSTMDVPQSVPFPHGKLVVKSTTPQCNGFLVETAADAYTACVQGPPGFEETEDHWAYDVAADDSVVWTSSNVPGIWLSRPGQAPVELDSDPQDEDPAISPDGSKVAFARTYPGVGPHGFSSSIYVIESDGSDLKLAVDGYGTELVDFPTFSPDGRTIAYIDYFSGIFLMNVDGSNKRMIVSGRVSGNGGLSWSPDAQWLALDMNGDAYAFHTDGSDLYNALDPDRQVTRGENEPEGGPENVQFTSDGSQILYEHDAIDGSGNFSSNWSVINPDGTDEHKVFMTSVAFTCPIGCNAPFTFTWGVVVPPATGGPIPKLVRPTQATVPNVHALGLRRASKILAGVRLTGRITQQRFSSRIRRGHVLSQYPRARARASLTKRRSRVVKLVLSRGPRPAKRR